MRLGSDSANTPANRRVLGGPIFKSGLRAWGSPGAGHARLNLAIPGRAQLGYILAVFVQFARFSGKRVSLSDQWHAGEGEGSWLGDRVSAHELKADGSRCRLMSSISQAGVEKLHRRPQRVCPDFPRLGDEKAQEERAFSAVNFPGASYCFHSSLVQDPDRRAEELSPGDTIDERR
jgi:hypothetical protein